MAKRPNILIMLSDQQRPDTLGCYGQSLPVSPHIDEWAGQGARFTNAFTPQPVCGPARSCLQTGRYATETGCYRNDIALPLQARTIGHRLSDAGYRVGYVGKWHLASTGAEHDYRTKPIPPDRRGGWRDFWVAVDVLEFTSHGYGGHFFDATGAKLEFEGYRVDATTDHALQFLTQFGGVGSNESDPIDTRPWCLFVSWIEPHHQNDHGHYEGPQGSKQRFADYTPPADLSPFEGDWRDEYPDYLGACSSIDENVGRMLKALHETGQWENTLKIYMSDHGSHFKTRNAEYKRSFHDASVHVPLILEGPGIPSDQTVSELSSLIDIPPTIMKAAGLEVSDMRGQPLQELFDETSPIVETDHHLGQYHSGGQWRSEVFIQTSESQIGRAIRTHRFKYGVSVPVERADDPRASSPAYVEECLYDLEADPAELENLLGHLEYDGERARLRERLLDYIEEVEGMRPEIFPHPDYAYPLV